MGTPGLRGGVPIRLASRKGSPRISGSCSSASAKVGLLCDPTGQRWLDGPRLRTVPADRRSANTRRLSDPPHTVLSEQDFRLEADRALEQAQRALLPLADEEGFEVELQNGVLQLVFEEPAPAKFVVSPNAPVRQMWVSAMSRSYKLSWAGDASSFMLDGEPLGVMLERLARQHLHSQ
jgi:iron-sulfur cluster assembly protein CyaY